MGRVLIADEQPLFRDALRGVLEQFSAKNWRFTCEEAGSFDALMALADDDDDLDAVLLDLSLLRQQGYGELVALRNKLPSVPVIVFCAGEHAEKIRLCLVCGVAGYVSKYASREDVMAALRTVFEGGTAVPRSDGPPAPGRRPAAAEDQDGGSLSDRQAAVLNLVTDGKSNKQIAWELSISETTVKAHMTAILRKLGVSSRAQAIVLLQRRPVCEALPYC